MAFTSPTETAWRRMRGRRVGLDEARTRPNRPAQSVRSLPDRPILQSQKGLVAAAAAAYAKSCRRSAITVGGVGPRARQPRHEGGHFFAGLVMFFSMFRMNTGFWVPMETSSNLPRLLT